MPPILTLIFDTTSTPRLARVPAIGQNLPFVQRYPSCSTRPQNAQPMDLVWLAAGLPIFADNAGAFAAVVAPAVLPPVFLKSEQNLRLYRAEGDSVANAPTAGNGLAYS